MWTYDGPVAALAMCCTAVLLSLSSVPADASDSPDRRSSWATASAAAAAADRRRYDEMMAVRRRASSYASDHDDEDHDVEADYASQYDFADQDDRIEDDGRTGEDDDGTGEDDDGGHDSQYYRVRPVAVDDKAKRGVLLHDNNNNNAIDDGDDNDNNNHRQHNGRKFQRPPYPATAYVGNGVRVDTSMLRGETVELPTYVNVPVTLRCKFVPVDGTDNKFETVVEAMRPGHAVPSSSSSDVDPRASRVLDQLIGSVEGWRDVVKSARPVRRAVVDKFRAPAVDHHRGQLNTWPVPLNRRQQRYRPDDDPADPNGSRPTDERHSARSSQSDEEYSMSSRRPVDPYSAPSRRPSERYTVPWTASTRRHHEGSPQIAARQRAAERLQRYRETHQPIQKWIAAAAALSRPVVAETVENPPVGWRQPQRELAENRLFGDRHQSDVVNDDDDDDDDRRSAVVDDQQSDEVNDDNDRQSDVAEDRKFDEVNDDEDRQSDVIEDRPVGEYDGRQSHGQQADVQQAYDQQVYDRQDASQQQAYGQQIYGEQDAGQPLAYDQQVDDHQQAYIQQVNRQHSYDPFGVDGLRAEDSSVELEEAGGTVERATVEKNDPSVREVGLVEELPQKVTADVVAESEPIVSDEVVHPAGIYENHEIPIDSAANQHKLGNH